MTMRDVAGRRVEMACQWDQLQRRKERAEMRTNPSGPGAVQARVERLNSEVGVSEGSEVADARSPEVAGLLQNTWDRLRSLLGAGR